MFKTMKDLLEYYNITDDTPEYMLNYKFSPKFKGFGDEHHREIRNGEIVHIFTKEYTYEDCFIKSEITLYLHENNSKFCLPCIIGKVYIDGHKIPTTRTCIGEGVIVSNS